VPAAGDRRAGAEGAAGADAADRPGAARRAGGPGPGRAGRHPGRALRDLGAGPRRAGEHRHDVAGAAPARLAAQKKTVVASERDEAERAAWREETAALAPEDLVFVDESSTNRAMAPRRARAPRGKRAVGSAPRNHGHNVTLLAALGPAGISAAMTVEGAADGAAFTAYVRQVLVPTLRPGQVVVLDNLSVHKGAPVRALVEAAGCRLLFLPAYSPDFNPIELAFAKLKERLRRAAARAYDALVEAIGEGLAAITGADARAFFAHCGLSLPDQLL
jgi:transposase